MIAADRPVNEAERLRVVRSLRLLDTPEERAFNLLAKALRETTGSDAALVSLLDQDRQWIKARSGFDGLEISRNASFCAHTILGTGVFCVEDVAADTRFERASAEALRFGSYAGAPVTVDGCNVGTVCVMNRRAGGFSAPICEQLTTFAELVAERFELRRRSNFNAAMLQGTSDAVVAVDADQAITFWNAAAERMFGLTALEAVGKPISIIVPERFRPAHDAGFARLMGGASPKLVGQTIEVPAVRSDGQEFPIELTHSLWREGGTVTVGAIIRDCSERTALNQARLANAAKDRFLASMSHEIRTPLNGVLGLGQVLAGTVLDERQRKMLDHMLASAADLNALMADVLEAASLQGGDIQLTPSVFDLAAMMIETAASHRAAIEAKGLSFTLAPVPQTLVVGCPGHIRGILDRLLGNALKFTDRGGVELSVSRHHEVWRFDVRDTGEGFDGGTVERLFEPFHQADDSSVRRHGGAGLGLFNARSLARALGGDIHALGEPGRGAVFSLQLPLPAATGGFEAAA